MTLQNFIFTSESVSEGHPDKVADQVSDSILDAIMAHDPRGRVACETLVKNNVVILAGEITSAARVDYENIARQVIRDIGYTEPKLGFDSETCSILSYISQQSPDISQGVNEGEGAFKEQGAGDQGIMFGFACDETADLLPLPISLSHQLMLEISHHRKEKGVSFLKPDAKSQVTVRYESTKPVAVETVVLSTQHAEETTLEEVRDYVIEQIIKKVIPGNLLTKETTFLINPTGKFVIGGPVGDCGLTGRKIIVDTYGGYSRHGGGAFSGKDPSKVDRSAAYAARHIAKNVVASGAAGMCEVQLAYAIGVAQPVSIYVNTFDTGRVPDAHICSAVTEIFDLSPKGIIESLDLLRPIYRKSAAHGHFGRKPTPDGHFSWEKLDRVDELKRAFGL
jgi:S-adenosylmethionine synthetase